MSESILIKPSILLLLNDFPGLEADELVLRVSILPFVLLAVQS